MKEKQTHHPEALRALQVFDPRKIGYTPSISQGVWKKNIPELGNIVVAPISWQHIHHQVGSSHSSTLELARQIQEEIFGIDGDDTVPTNTLAILEKTGGKSLAVYKERDGFTPEGWLGLIIGFGSSNGTLVSHMLGVKEEYKTKLGIGSDLKIIQAHEAIKTSHHGITWTYDLIRGVNANLNIRKLGGEVSTFVVDLYGKLQSKLYGQVPTDRFVVEWDLFNQEVHEKIEKIKSSKKEDPTEITRLLKFGTKATLENIDGILRQGLSTVLVEIPSSPADPKDTTAVENEIINRLEKRKLLSMLLDTNYTNSQSYPGHPTSQIVYSNQGAYRVSDFISLKSGEGRQNAYILTRK